MREAGKTWTITVLPISTQAASEWFMVLAAVLFLSPVIFDRYPSNGPLDPLKLAFWAVTVIVTAYPALWIARIRCAGNQAAVATGLWNFLRPTRIDWTQLDAIRLHIAPVNLRSDLSP